MKEKDKLKNEIEKFECKEYSDIESDIEFVSDSYLVKQPYKLVKLKYDISRTEKKIFLKIIELCQKYERGESMEKGCSIEMIIGKMSGKEAPEITFPIKDMISNTHRNYEMYKEGLKKIATRPFHIPDEKWDFTLINLFERIQGSEKGGVFKVKMTESFWDLFHAKGAFKYIDTGVAYGFKSIHSARMYDLLVGNKIRQGFKMEHLMALFGKEDKSTGWFIQKVIKVAEAELREKDTCPFYFEYTIGKKGKKYDVIYFDVISKKTDEVITQVLENENLEKDASVLNSGAINVKVKNFATLMFELEELSSSLEAKLMEAQNLMGVDGLIKKLREIYLTMQGQILKVSTGAYLMGALKIIIGDAEKKQERKNNAKKMAEDAVVITETKKSEEDGIYTFEFLEGRAKLAGTTVDEIIKCMNLELEEDNKYRKKK